MELANLTNHEFRLEYRVEKDDFLAQKEHLGEYLSEASAYSSEKLREEDVNPPSIDQMSPRFGLSIFKNPALWADQDLIDVCKAIREKFGGDFNDKAYHHGDHYRVHSMFDGKLSIDNVIEVAEFVKETFWDPHNPNIVIRYSVKYRNVPADVVAKADKKGLGTITGRERHKIPAHRLPKSKPEDGV